MIPVSCWLLERHINAPGKGSRLLLPLLPGMSALALPHALPVCGQLGQPPFLEVGARRGTPTGLCLPLLGF